MNLIEKFQNTEIKTPLYQIDQLFSSSLYIFFVNRERHLSLRYPCDVVILYTLIF